MTSVKNMLPRYIFGHHPHDSPPGLSRWHALRCCLSSSLVPSGAYGENRHNFRWRHWDQQKSPRSKKVWRNLNLHEIHDLGIQPSSILKVEFWCIFFSPTFLAQKLLLQVHRISPFCKNQRLQLRHTFIVQLVVHASVKMDGNSFLGDVPFSGEPKTNSILAPEHGLWGVSFGRKKNGASEISISGFFFEDENKKHNHLDTSTVFGILGSGLKKDLGCGVEILSENQNRKKWQSIFFTIKNGEAWKKNGNRMTFKRTRSVTLIKVQKCFKRNMCYKLWTFQLCRPCRFLLLVLGDSCSQLEKLVHKKLVRISPIQSDIVWLWKVLCGIEAA